MNNVLDKDLLQQLLVRFGGIDVQGKKKQPVQDGDWMITGDGHSALLVSKTMEDGIELPTKAYATLNDLVSLGKPPGCFNIDVLRSSTMDFVGKFIDLSLYKSAYVIPLKEDSHAVAIGSGHYCLSYIDDATRMIMGIGAENVEVYEKPGSMIQMVARHDGEVYAIAIVMQVLDPKKKCGGIIVHSADYDCEVNQDLQRQNMKYLDAFDKKVAVDRKACRRLYEVQLARYATYYVLAETPSEAKSIALDNEDQWDFEDAEVDSMQPVTSDDIDTECKVFDKDGEVDNLDDEDFIDE